jgi:hypothetical protein
LNGGSATLPKLNNLFTLINRANHVEEFFKLVSIFTDGLLILVSPVKFLTHLHSVIERETEIKQFCIELVKSPVLLVARDFLNIKVICFTIQEVGQRESSALRLNPIIFNVRIAFFHKSVISARVGISVVVLRLKHLQGTTSGTRTPAASMFLRALLAAFPLGMFTRFRHV